MLCPYSSQLVTQQLSVAGASQLLCTRRLRQSHRLRLHDASGPKPHLPGDYAFVSFSIAQWFNGKPSSRCPRFNLHISYSRCGCQWCKQWFSLRNSYLNFYSISGWLLLLGSGLRQGPRRHPGCPGHRNFSNNGKPDCQPWDSLRGSPKYSGSKFREKIT